MQGDALNENFYRTVSFLLFFFSSAALAVDCNTSGNQMEINKCALDDFNAADRKLNKTWKSFLKSLKGDKKQIKKFRESQRAWIKFRDTEVDAMYYCDSKNKRICWGSMYPTLYHDAMARLTRDRTKQLQKHLRDVVSSVDQQPPVKNDGLLIGEKSFFGIRLGDRISSHSRKLKKGILRTGEGDFDVYHIRDGKRTLGHLMSRHDNSKRVGNIVITTPKASTKSGIRVGSTLGDLEKVLPDLEIHGSEIEGWTHASSKSSNISYKLDVYISTYKVDRAKVKKSTKITEIDI